MRPLLLDEAQGLTNAKRDNYLIAKGWTTKGGGWHNEPHSLPKRVCEDRDGAWLRFLADFEGRSMQVILREMNVRFRKGVPTDAAIVAHRANATWGRPWLALDEHGNPRVGFWTKPAHRVSEPCPYSFYVQGRGYLSKERVADWSFWPADRHLERVRWPEHDGQML